MEYDVITGRVVEIKDQLNNLKEDYIIEVLGMCSHKTDICMAISKREFKLAAIKEGTQHMRIELGKIKNVNFGNSVGYQNACFGISFTLGGDGWGVGSGMEAWDMYKIKCDKYAKWTEEDRSKQYDEIMRYISKLLHEAKVSEVYALKEIPIEATFDGNLLKSWRILTEVI